MTLLDILRKYQGDRSLREYAELLDISPSHLSQVFSGVRNPGLPIFRALAQKFPGAADEIAEALKSQPGQMAVSA